MFADDLLLFYKADPPLLRLVMLVLRLFYMCAGLQANLQKSQMVLGGVSTTLHDLCLQETGLTSSQHPLKYLGVPITASHLIKLNVQHSWTRY